MSNQYLLAIDAGTGSIRAVLFDTSGEQKLCVQEEWTHKEDPRWPGSMDFDWDSNWELAKKCIRGVIDGSKISPENIIGISTTCMREGIVLYDKNGKELWACANVDARSTDEVSQLINLNPALEKQIYLKSGQTYALGALPRLLWVKNKLPEVYEKVAKIGMFNDWLIYKLTGIMALEPSNGSTTGIFDLVKRNWDPSIAESCGLKSEIFPSVYESGTVASGVSTFASTETGLTPGTPVIVGGGDAQLGSVGVGVIEPDSAAIFGGSFWQYEYNTNKVIKDKDFRVRVNCHSVPGVWQYEALAFKPGLVMRWFRDAFCQEEKNKALLLGIDPYDLMNAEAEKIPAGSYGMLCAFSDIMNFINWKHASPSFIGFELDSDKYNKYTFYRSILENTAMITLGHLDLVEEVTGNRPNEIVFAGGASKSPLWCQILSDVLGIPIKVPKVKEATALGTAIIAAYGVGVYKSIQEAAESMIKWDITYYPSSDNHVVYQRTYERWKQVYKHQLQLCDKGLTKNMWAAPGVK